QIAIDGGLPATWARGRLELLYSTLDGRIMEVSYSADGDSFKADKPRQWGEGRLTQRQRLGPFDIDPDGERLALAPVAERLVGGAQDRIVLVFNFFDELRRVAPMKRSGN